MAQRQVGFHINRAKRAPQLQEYKNVKMLAGEIPIIWECHKFSASLDNEVSYLCHRSLSASTGRLSSSSNLSLWSCAETLRSSDRTPSSGAAAGPSSSSVRTPEPGRSIGAAAEAAETACVRTVKETSLLPVAADAAEMAMKLVTVAGTSVRNA